jgi:hypothetical protein
MSGEDRIAKGQMEIRVMDPGVRAGIEIGIATGSRVKQRNRSHLTLLYHPRKNWKTKNKIG